MKTNASLKTTIALLSVAVLVALSFSSFAQSGTQSIPELVFKNPVLESGTTGANGAVYRFSDVATNIDALVKIAGRSSSNVRISNIDMTSTGHANAFQPQISYNNGNAPSNTNWWMDFDFNFVNKGSLTPVSVTSFNLTAIDVDGDGSRLHEYVSFMAPQSYLLENNSLLSVTSIFQTILNVLTPGKQFDGPTRNFADIDVNATEVMTTVNYVNKSSFRLRAGGATSGGSSSAADRMYSLWFKGFNYNIPMQVILPVKLESFTAILNNSSNKVDLRWVTSSEKNVSHFAVEKSTDGKNFADAGLVFAFGNTNDIMNYTFTDMINTQDKVIYYRLRTVDADGKFDYSATRIIRTGKQAENTVSILTYPNPVTSELRITIPGSWQGKKVTYELLNANAQVTKKAETGSASQTETMNVNSLTPGLYVVKVSCGTETTTQKIIKR